MSACEVAWSEKPEEVVSILSIRKEVLPREVYVCTLLIVLYSCGGVVLGRRRRVDVFISIAREAFVGLVDLGHAALP